MNASPPLQVAPQVQVEAVGGEDDGAEALSSHSRRLGVARLPGATRSGSSLH